MDAGSERGSYTMRPEAIVRRAHWVAELAKLSGSFGDDSARMIEEFGDERRRDGVEALLDHLRLCGAMPEQYGHDSSEEKLYAKYTDAVISESLTALGLQSVVNDVRADAADVQARASAYSLVADGKAFRLSRTAKNQKDFKIQAMDGWRNGLEHAMVVCPIYQLPTRTSQIYMQAIARNVCILSYSHLAALIGLARRRGQRVGEDALGSILNTVLLLNPSKSSVDYWTGINRSLTEALEKDIDIWTEEKTASLEALDVVKDESLGYLRMELHRLLGLSHKEALKELVRMSGLNSRIAQVERVTHGRLLGD